MVPRCIFMQPNSIGPRTNHTTYIQNNYFGAGSRPQNIWTCGYPTMRPMYYQQPCYGYSYGYSNWMPGFVQNAITRFMGFSLMQNLFKPGDNPRTEIEDPALLTRNDMEVTTDELNEVNQRYET